MGSRAVVQRDIVSPSLRRFGVLAAALPVAFAVVGSACGAIDEAAREPLPSIRTTTSTTTIPGTTLPEGTRIFYTIKRGDTLASIAAATGVTVQSIIELNNITDPDSIPAGVTIEIPDDVFVIDDLDSVTTTTES